MWASAGSGMSCCSQQRLCHKDLSMDSLACSRRLACDSPVLMLQAGALTDHLLPTVILKAQLPQAVQALPPPIFKPGQRGGGPYVAIKPLQPQYLQLHAPSTGARPADAAARDARDESTSSLEADPGVHQNAARSQQPAGIRRLHLYCITVAAAREQTGPDDTGERHSPAGQLLCWLTRAYATLAADSSMDDLLGACCLAKLRNKGMQSHNNASTPDVLMLQVVLSPAPSGC